MGAGRGGRSSKAGQAQGMVVEVQGLQVIRQEGLTVAIAEAALGELGGSGEGLLGE